MWIDVNNKIIAMSKYNVDLLHNNFTSGRQHALREVPPNSLKYSYTSDILHCNLGGDVVKE
jgi:hypothetical protein